MNPRLTDVFRAIEGAVELVFKLDKLRVDLGAMSYDVARLKVEQKKLEERLAALETVDIQPSGRIADFGRSVSKERPEPPLVVVETGFDERARVIRELRDRLKTAEAD